MSWDKRATVRRPGNEAKRDRGMFIVYVGLSPEAVAQGIADPSTLRVGDSFRLLPGSAITLGRSELCEITVDDDALSRAHALVSFVPGPDTKLVLVDLKSQNGTWVGGRGAPVQHIEPGAVFSLAKTYLFRVQPARS
jgi:pSer/pThr/pTyr-binding forkhead associated (FHA) protein